MLHLYHSYSRRSAKRSERLRRMMWTSVLQPFTLQLDALLVSNMYKESLVSIDSTCHSGDTVSLLLSHRSVSLTYVFHTLAFFVISSPGGSSASYYNAGVCVYCSEYMWVLVGVRVTNLEISRVPYRRSFCFLSCIGSLCVCFWHG